MALFAIFASDPNSWTASLSHLLFFLSTCNSERFQWQRYYFILKSLSGCIQLSGLDISPATLAEKTQTFEPQSVC